MHNKPYKWGVFPLDKEIHVVPVDTQGYPAYPHILDTICICTPTTEPNTKTIVIHREEQ